MFIIRIINVHPSTTLQKWKKKMFHKYIYKKNSSKHIIQNLIKRNVYPFRKFFENLYINVLWFISPSFIHKIPIHPFHPRPTLKNVNSVRQTSSLQHSFTVSLKTDFLENAWCTYGELPPPPPVKIAVRIRQPEVSIPPENDSSSFDDD